MSLHAPAASAPAIVAPNGAPPKRRIVRAYLAILVGFHLLLPLAFLPYTLTWWAIPILLLGNFLFGSIGINLAYHRLLTHRAVVLPKWLEKVFVVCGVCSMEGPPLKWVLTHRIHHQTSDADGDPHSPVGDFFWGHMGWIYTDDPRFKSGATYEKYVPDLMTDKFMKWLHKKNRWVKIYFYHVLATVFVPPLVVLAVTWGDWEAALRVMAIAFTWGLVARTVYVWHITWFVNSAAHRWGYQNYSTGDKSRNNWWVALLTNGEGWHNNHHASPRAAAHGHRWWEVDLTYTFVRMLQVLGLAKEIVPVKVAGYKEKGD